MGFFANVSIWFSIEEQLATFETAIERAARILSDSRDPLIFGLPRSSTPGHQTENI